MTPEPTRAQNPRERALCAPTGLPETLVGFLVYSSILWLPGYLALLHAVPCNRRSQLFLCQKNSPSCQIRDGAATPVFA
jgi:hypothetical protein